MSFLASSRFRREERLRFRAGDYFYETGNLAHTTNNPTKTPAHVSFVEFCQTIGRLPQSSRRSHSRAHGGCGRRGDVPSRLRPGTRRHRVEAGDQPLLPAVRGLGQAQEPGLRAAVRGGAPLVTLSAARLRDQFARAFETASAETVARCPSFVTFWDDTVEGWPRAGAAWSLPLVVRVSSAWSASVGRDHGLTERGVLAAVLIDDAHRRHALRHELGENLLVVVTGRVLKATIKVNLQSRAQPQDP